jgi:hypothetical protein
LDNSTPVNLTNPLRYLWQSLAGAPDRLPADMAASWPELAGIRWRRGGLPPRFGGWLLGRPTVAGVTLWRTVYLAPGVEWEPQLLLHEYRHVEQFAGSALFPLLYLWESLVRGYSGNRYEADADLWAARRLLQETPLNPHKGA